MTGQQLTETVAAFVNESPYLREEREFLQNGKKMISFNKISLQQILEDYIEIEGIGRFAACPIFTTTPSHGDRTILNHFCFLLLI